MICLIAEKNLNVKLNPFSKNPLKNLKNRINLWIRFAAHLYFSEATANLVNRGRIFREKMVEKDEMTICFVVA